MRTHRFGKATKLRIENLEGRAMLSGNSIGHAVGGGRVDDRPAHVEQQRVEQHRGADDAAAQARQQVFSSLASSAAAAPGNVHTELQASLTGIGTAIGRAKFEVEQEHGVTQTSLAISIQGAAASSTLDVSIDGAPVGVINTDVNGVGSLRLTSGIPAITANSTITVGGLQGTFAAPQATDNLPPGGVVAAKVELQANLTGPAGGVGQARLQVEPEHGATQTSFTVSVRSAAPSSTLDVAIDGVIVGRIATDANGNGRLSLNSNPRKTGDVQLPANFPAVTAASKITVGTLSGAFNGNQAGDDHGQHGPGHDSNDINPSRGRH